MFSGGGEVNSIVSSRVDHLPRKKVELELGGIKSTPVRRVEAGEFILEAWIEEGRAKLHDDAD